MTLPDIALSIRQPWAYVVAIGWKDIENRDWRKPNPGLNFRGPIAIHASSGMTRHEYEHAADFINRTGFQAPPPHELARGAIIGTADIIDIVKQSDSPWFFGRLGLVMANARMLEQPIPCSGALGYFKWKRGGEIALPAKWMLPEAPPPAAMQGSLI
jgi:hypothetical protein